MENVRTIDKLVFIEIQNRKVLVSLSVGKTIWYIPGGKREPNETDQQALIREVKEELSVEILPESMKHYGTFKTQAHGKTEGTMVQMTCYTASYTGNLVPAAEIEKIDWFTHSKSYLTSSVDQIIIDDLKHKNLIN